MECCASWWGQPGRGCTVVPKGHFGAGLFPASGSLLLFPKRQGMWAPWTVEAVRCPEASERARAAEATGKNKRQQPSRVSPEAPQGRCAGEGCATHRWVPGPTPLCPGGPAGFHLRAGAEAGPVRVVWALAAPSPAQALSPDVLTDPSRQLSPSIPTGFEWQPQLLRPVWPPARCQAPRFPLTQGAQRGGRPFLGLSVQGTGAHPRRPISVAVLADKRSLFQAWCWLSSPLPKEEGNADTLPGWHRPCTLRPQKGQRGPGGEVSSGHLASFLLMSSRAQPRWCQGPQHPHVPKPKFREGLGADPSQGDTSRGDTFSLPQGWGCLADLSPPTLPLCAPDLKPPSSYSPDMV